VAGDFFNNDATLISNPNGFNSIQPGKKASSQGLNAWFVRKQEITQLVAMLTPTVNLENC